MDIGTVNYSAWLQLALQAKVSEMRVRIPSSASVVKYGAEQRGLAHLKKDWMRDWKVGLLIYPTNVHFHQIFEAFKTKHQELVVHLKSHGEKFVFQLNLT